MPDTIEKIPLKRFSPRRATHAARSGGSAGTMWMPRNSTSPTINASMRILRLYFVTRFLPACLARYNASSAALIIARALCSGSVLSATPMLTVTEITF